MPDPYNDDRIQDHAPIDIEAAARFLTLLDPGATEFEFRTFDDNVDRDDPNLLKTFYGTLAEHADELKRLNERGAGVFVTINETDGKGRKAENILRVRAVFADLDGVPLTQVMAGRLKPHIIVESSANRWHCYWLVEGMALQDFAAVQKAIIERFHSDPKVHDLPRVMRLPGFVHAKIKDGVKSKPFTSRIVSSSDGPAYPASNFEKVELEVHTPGEQSSVTLLDQWKAAGALEVIPNDNLEWGEWNHVGMAMWRATGGSQYGFEAFNAWSAKSSKYNARRTAKVWSGYFRSKPHSLGLGTLIFLADQAAPDWRDKLMAEITEVMSGGGS
jgi:Primase C terminal 2 (PriCT-2)/RepB DNA-primase from phage plasmid